MVAKKKAKKIPAKKTRRSPRPSSGANSGKRSPRPSSGANSNKRSPRPSSGANSNKRSPRPSSGANSGKRSPRPSGISNSEKKISAIAESTKLVSMEIKTVSKTFADSYKILASMKSMISTLSATMQHIDRHSRQISLLEAESQKISSNLQHVLQKSDGAKSLNAMASDMEKRIAAIEKEGDATQIKNTVAECLKIAKNSEQHMVKFSDTVRKIPAVDMDKVEEKLSANRKILEDVSQRLQSHAKDQANPGEVRMIKVADEVSNKISAISREIAGLREQTRSISEAQKTDEMTEHMGAISSKAEVLMDMPAQLSKIQSLLESMEEKISSKKNAGGSAQLQHPELLEYQASMHMISESKYGNADDLKSMAVQTVKILQASDKDSPNTLDISKWGVLRMLECSDKWELRFSDTLSMMKETLGAEVLKKSVQIRQIKDVYGMRAVDDTKTALNIS